MGYMRALCEIGRDTLAGADVSTNTWHFETVGTVAASADAAVDKLEVFYNAIDAWLAQRNASSINVKIYDLEDPSPRVPVLEQAFAITTAGTLGLPEECAVCLSYMAAPVSGLSPARRRGRIYLGPLAATTSADTGQGRIEVAAAFLTAVGTAASNLADTPSVDPVWSVFSPTTAGPPPWDGGSLGPAFFPVAMGYIDNAFDTVRSRGAVSTARTTFTV